MVPSWAGGRWLPKPAAVCVNQSTLGDRAGVGRGSLLAGPGDLRVPTPVVHVLLNLHPREVDGLPVRNQRARPARQGVLIERAARGVGPLDLGLVAADRVAPGLVVVAEVDDHAPLAAVARRAIERNRAAADQVGALGIEP